MYVDDELPDYIMVMIANHKTGEQMAEDLRLFLNENTDGFVEWLVQVLAKLKKVTAGELKIVFLCFTVIVHKDRCSDST